MINIPYTSLVPGGQTLPQIPVMPAARGQTAQAMQGISSALSNQQGQSKSILDAYMKQAPQPQQASPQTFLALPDQSATMQSMQVPGYNGSTTTLGGLPMQNPIGPVNITMPTIPPPGILDSSFWPWNWGS